MGRIFGTDGIRGRANEPPLTPDFVQRIGVAAGAAFTRGDHRHHVVIGKDTRLSGYMMETALTSGFLSIGMNVFLVGPIPTAAIPMLVRSMRCDLGVMISGSHNAWQDNGIKLFGQDGRKLSEDVERALEERLQATPAPNALAVAARVGRAKRIDDAVGRYNEWVKATVPSNLRLDGLKVVVDCANGAAWRVTPQVLWELGAEVVAMGVAPDGTNINRDCGSTAPDAMAARVRETGADLGIALDGDADRCVLADERGRIVDGDRLIGLIAREWLESGKLAGGAVVGTPFSNLGFERFLGTLHLDLLRAPVGDRHVSRWMRSHGCNVGGEPSGHIILADHGETGDGLASALQALAVMARTGSPLSALLPRYEAVPQHLSGVGLPNGRSGDPLAVPSVRAAVAEAERRLRGKGRLVVRTSGTEPLLRVLVETPDEPAARDIVELISAAVATAGRTAA